jgi:hypothetical protein
MALERKRFRDEIYERIRRRAANQPRWSVPRLGIRFDPRTFALLRRAGLRGPLWQHLDKVPGPALLTRPAPPGRSSGTTRP